MMKTDPHVLHLDVQFAAVSAEEAAVTAGAASMPELGASCDVNLGPAQSCGGDDGGTDPLCDSTKTFEPVDCNPE